MFEAADKMFLAGLGALSMTRERAEAIFDEYVKKGTAAKEARSGFVKDAVEAAEKTRTELEKLIDQQIEKSIRRMNLATKDDLARLEAKVDALNAAQGSQ